MHGLLRCPTIGCIEAAGSARAHLLVLGGMRSSSASSCATVAAVAPHRFFRVPDLDPEPTP
jgi:hypothetical protein